MKKFWKVTEETCFKHASLMAKKSWYPVASAICNHRWQSFGRRHKKCNQRWNIQKNSWKGDKEPLSSRFGVLKSQPSKVKKETLVLFYNAIVKKLQNQDTQEEVCILDMLEEDGEADCSMNWYIFVSVIFSWQSLYLMNHWVGLFVQ